ncbi:MAG: pilus assembly protein TadG-related protein [Actinomycetota bacterium]
MATIAAVGPAPGTDQELDGAIERHARRDTEPGPRRDRGRRAERGPRRNARWGTERGPQRDGGWGAERGSVSTFVVLMVVPVLMMAALAFDGGVLLAERRGAFDAAQNAALAGSQALATNEARQGLVTLAADDAIAAAQAYLATNGDTGTVTVSPLGGPTSVTVTVDRQVPMRLLGVIGVADKTVTATATSRISRGVDAADT